MPCRERLHHMTGCSTGKLDSELQIGPVVVYPWLDPRQLTVLCRMFVVPDNASAHRR